MESLQKKNDEAFRLEGVELIRGNRTDTRLRTVELADGSWVDLPVIVLRGAEPGPCFYLGAAFHGDEANGVEIATRFASQPEVLSGLRARLPGWIANSDVGNPVLYTRAVEAHYRRFWRDYCASPGA